jgi:hypothetical protein
MFRIRRDAGSAGRRHSHPIPGTAARRRAGRTIALAALCLLLPLTVLSTGSAAAKSRGPVLPGLPAYSSIPRILARARPQLGLRGDLDQ